MSKATYLNNDLCYSNIRRCPSHQDPSRVNHGRYIPKSNTKIPRKTMILVICGAPGSDSTLGSGAFGRGQQILDTARSLQGTSVQGEQSAR